MKPRVYLSASNTVILDFFRELSTNDSGMTAPGKSSGRCLCSDPFRLMISVGWFSSFHTLLPAEGVRSPRRVLWRLPNLYNEGHIAKATTFSFLSKRIAVGGRLLVSVEKLRRRACMFT